MGTESEFKLITTKSIYGLVCLDHYEGHYTDKKLTIPEGIQFLTDGCLKGLDIEEITLPQTIKSIRGTPFEGCNKLKIINFSFLLTHFDENSVRGLKNIEQINGHSIFFKSIQGFLCDDNNRLIFCPKGKIKGDVVLPEGITGLTKEYRPFLRRSNITSLTLPLSLLHIHNEALVGLKNVHSLHFTKNIGFIDSDILVNNKNITSWSIDKDNPYFIHTPEYLYNKEYNELVYVNKELTSSFVLPNTCKHIRKDAFVSSNFTSITIPKEVNISGIYGNSLYTPHLFKDCKNLKEIHFENKKTIIKEVWFVDRYMPRREINENGENGAFLRLLKFFYPSQLDKETKMKFLKDIFSLIQDEDSTISVEWKEAWLNYFKRCRKHYNDLILQDSDVFKFYTQNNLLTIGSVQDLIELSNEMNLFEITSHLLEYENRHFSMEERIKESNKMFKIENPNTITYLRKTFKWEITKDNTISILSYKGKDKEIFVPETIAGLIVTEIEDTAFSPYQRRISSENIRNRKKIEKIILPPTINYIGNSAFACCESLKDINIPEGIEEIYYRTFEGCVSLETITIPSTVKGIHLYAFMNCKEITLLNKDTKIDDFNAFNEKYKGIIKSLPGGKVENYAKENEIVFIPIEETNKKDY